MGGNRAARKLYERVLTIDPGYAPSLQARPPPPPPLRTLISATCIPTIRTYLSSSHSVRMWGQKGMYHIKGGCPNWNDASDAAHVLITFVSWIQALGVMEARAGRCQTARGYFKRAVAADPQHAWSYQVILDPRP